MLVVGDILVAVALMRLLDRLYAVHQSQRRRAIRLGEHFLHPGVACPADVENNVRLVHRARVGGRRFVAVRVHAGADEQRQPFLAAKHLPRQVVTGKIRGHHARPCLRRFSGGAAAQGQAQRQNQSEKFAHRISFQSEFQIQFHSISSIAIFPILSSYDSQHARNRPSRPVPAGARRFSPSGAFFSPARRAGGQFA